MAIQTSDSRRTWSARRRSPGPAAVGLVVLVTAAAALIVLRIVLVDLFQVL